MRGFDQIFLFFVTLNISILWANFTNVFPEKYNPLIDQLKDIQTRFEQFTESFENPNLDTFIQLGGFMYSATIFALQLFLGAPYFVNQTLRSLIHPYDNIFGIFIDGLMIINYIVFVVWILDILRGGRISSIY